MKATVKTEPTIVVELTIEEARLLYSLVYHMSWDESTKFGKISADIGQELATAVAEARDDEEKPVYMSLSNLDDEDGIVENEDE